MKSRILASTLMIVALIAVVGGSAFAIFRDAEFIPGNSISAGSIDISLTDGTTQFPSPIVAEGLMPGEWSEWSRVHVTNNSAGAVKLYFLVKDVEGAACHGTDLEVATGVAGENESEFTVFNGNIKDVKGVGHKVEVTGLVHDPALAAGAVAALQIRAGLNADADEMGGSCSWTGVFLAEPSAEDGEEEPPVSTPVSSPEEVYTFRF